MSLIYNIAHVTNVTGERRIYESKEGYMNARGFVETCTNVKRRHVFWECLLLIKKIQNESKCKCTGISGYEKCVYKRLTSTSSK